MLGYLSFNIICSSKLTVFLELRSRKTVRFSEQIMFADKYPSIFSRQMGAIVYIFPNFQNCARREKDLKNNKHNNLHLGRSSKLTVPKTSSEFLTVYVLGQLFASRNRQCQRTNILASFRAKWRLFFIILGILSTRSVSIQFT